MLQANRDDPNLTEPLLKVLIVIDENIKVEEQDSCADILNLLRRQVTRYEAPAHSGLLKIIVASYKRL